MNKEVLLVVIWGLLLATLSQARELELTLISDGVDHRRIQLSAILTTPDNIEPRSVTVILPGSVATAGLDGDVSSPLLGVGYKGAPAQLSLQTATALARAGIASLRFAKRGVEDETELQNQTAPYLVADALAAVELVVKLYPDLKVSITGFSEGALLALKAYEEKLHTDRPIDGLFLLSVPTRSIDEVIAYLSVEWPLNILRNRVDVNRDYSLSTEELKPLSGLPVASLFGIEPQSLDLNNDGSLSMPDEVIPAYQKKVQGRFYDVLNSDQQMRSWLEAMREFPSFEKLASKVEVPVFVYQSMDDAQVNYAWVASDLRHFKTLAGQRFYRGLGHCFSPMDGLVGEVKTSGPFSEELLEQLAADESNF